MGRLGRIVVGLDGRDLPRTGESSGKVSADEAETKVSFDDVDLRCTLSFGGNGPCTL